MDKLCCCSQGYWQFVADLTKNMLLFLMGLESMCVRTHIITVLLIELAMTKQTPLESNLICGTLNQKPFTLCVVRVYTACLHTNPIMCFVAYRF